MQIMESWDPLKLPRGSVRAIVALAITGALWATMLLDREVPLALAFVSLMVLAHYFGYRTKASSAGGKAPLFLPRGSIRVLLILGFAAVAFVLWDRGELQASMRDRNSTILGLVAALILGFVVKGIADLVTGGRAVTPRRWYENAKAVVALIAVGAFILFCFMDPGVAQKENLGLLSAPILIFYLGSRD